MTRRIAAANAGSGSWSFQLPSTLFRHGIIRRWEQEPARLQHGYGLLLSEVIQPDLVGVDEPALTPQGLAGVG